MAERRMRELVGDFSDRECRIIDGMAAESDMDFSEMIDESLGIGFQLQREIAKGGTLFLQKGPNAEPVELEVLK